MDFDADWERSILDAARATGHPAGPLALDYFVFSRGLYREIPDFAVGRANWDNWMVFGARSAGADVVDLTPSVVAVHQRHDYGHHEAGAARRG